MSVITFNEIDHWVKTLDADAIEAQALPDAPADRVQKAIAIYRFVRPLFAAFAVTPLISNQWKAAVQMFIVALDALSADGASGEFKAGKDL
jgi:hypothetical protein